VACNGCAERGGGGVCSELLSGSGCVFPRTEKGLVPVMAGCFFFILILYNPKLNHRPLSRPFFKMVWAFRKKITSFQICCIFLLIEFHILLGLLDEFVFTP
jgi:hypothetical protein